MISVINASDPVGFCIASVSGLIWLSNCSDSADARLEQGDKIAPKSQYVKVLIDIDSRLTYKRMASPISSDRSYLQANSLLRMFQNGPRSQVESAFKEPYREYKAFRKGKQSGFPSDELPDFGC